MADPGEKGRKKERKRREESERRRRGKRTHGIGEKGQNEQSRWQARVLTGRWPPPFTFTTPATALYGLLSARFHDISLLFLDFPAPVCRRENGFSNSSSLSRRNNSIFEADSKSQSRLGVSIVASVCRLMYTRLCLWRIARKAGKYSRTSIE